MVAVRGRNIFSSGVAMNKEPQLPYMAPYHVPASKL